MHARKAKPQGVTGPGNTYSIGVVAVILSCLVWPTVAPKRTHERPLSRGSATPRA